MCIYIYIRLLVVVLFRPRTKTYAIKIMVDNHPKSKKEPSLLSDELRYRMVLLPMVLLYVDYLWRLFVSMIAKGNNSCSPLFTRHRACDAVKSILAWPALARGGSYYSGMAWLPLVVPILWSAPSIHRPPRFARKDIYSTTRCKHALLFLREE